MEYPHIAQNPERLLPYSETSVEQYLTGMKKIQDEIRAHFPGVLAHVGSISDGSGFGFTTVIIQGEHVAHASGMFPDALVSAMSPEDYQITLEQSTEDVPRAA